jgi:hypothetical protein
MAYPGPGPATTAAALVAGVLPHSAGPYVAMLCLGFVLGAYGHLVRIRLLVVVGILLILLATLILPVALMVTNQSPEPPPPDQFPGGSP